jgi:hypothetical protein
MEHERRFLGSGWAFPVDTDYQGAVELASAEADIEQAIRIILGTAPGERVMRPEFGCDIHSYAFTTVNTTTVTLIEDAVEQALVRWEPRIDVDLVEVQVDDLAEGRLLIDVQYTVRRTNNEFNLVYPFYLEEV